MTDGMTMLMIRSTKGRGFWVGSALVTVGHFGGRGREYNQTVV